jgi:hypothetical protein
VTTDNHGYCWGNNSNYQIGDGTSTSFSRPKPVLVAGGLSFRALSAGSGYISPAGDPSPDDALSCSVTTTNRAYCWGSGSTGNLFGSATPVEVAGGRRYITVSAGTQGCGVTLAGGLYCWGHRRRFTFPPAGCGSPESVYPASAATRAPSARKTGRIAGETTPRASSATVRPALARSRSRLGGDVKQRER